MRPVGKVYVGVRLPPLNSAGDGVVLVLDPERKQSHYLPHICEQNTPRAKALVKRYGCHSTGFNWGYGGSGPAELAFMLLLDLGVTDERAWMAHQPLKSQILAGLDQDKPWMLSARRLRAWLLHFENGMIGRHATPEEVAHAIREVEEE